MADSPPRPDSLPAPTRLGRVRLQVADLERSLGFWRDLLGLRALRADGTSGGRAAALGAPGGDEPLVELVERPRARPVPPTGRLGLYHVALLLPDRASLGRFLRHLAATGVRAGAADHLFSEALYLSDPDGLGVEVYADRPREGWPRRDGKLLSASDPLDAQGLARAAGDAPWDGVPAGTTVGHVHLHVGDLHTAEAFWARGAGFEPTIRSFPGALFVAAGGYHHHLGLNTWSRSAPAGPDDARLLDWEVVLPAEEDVAAVARRLEALGVATEGGDARVAATDPWGAGVRFRAGSSPLP